MSGYQRKGVWRQKGWVCDIDGCEEPGKAKGMCKSHYSKATYVPPIQSAYCKLCGVLKDRQGWYCTACTNSKTLQMRINSYGMSMDAALAVMEAQGNACAVCSTPITWATTHIDHDHACCDNEYNGSRTKANSCSECVRGFLCAGCNVGLGSFNDDASRLESAAMYIRSWNASKLELPQPS